MPLAIPPAGKVWCEVAGRGRTHNQIVDQGLPEPRDGGIEREFAGGRSEGAVGRRREVAASGDGDLRRRLEITREDVRRERVGGIRRLVVELGGESVGTFRWILRRGVASVQSASAAATR